jgi:hypothetical protein
MKKLALAAALVLVMGCAAFAGPYLRFEQALVSAGLGRPACDTTLGFAYSAGGFYETGEQTQTLSISGDLYVTKSGAWFFPAVVLGHDLTLAWERVDVDVLTEIDLIAGLFTADLKLIGYVTEYLTLWGRVAGSYGVFLWSVEPYLGLELFW